MTTLQIAIRRAIQAECTFDFLSLHKNPPVQTSRVALSRILSVFNAITSIGGQNASSLAKRFSTSTKTIHRDIKFIKSNLCSGLSYNEITHAYEVSMT